jgi:hypothetical protein
MINLVDQSVHYVWTNLAYHNEMLLFLELKHKMQQVQLAPTYRDKKRNADTLI